MLALAVAIAGCTSAAPAQRPGASASAPSAPAQTRTLVMILNTEVGNLSYKAVGPVNPARTTRAFNAGMTLIDGEGNARPYLAESMPQVNTDSWQVFPDGRMENTWKLRPNLTWHDGSPLTADDFVFAFQVYTAPSLAVFEPKPQNLIERMVAVDPRTVRITWRSPYLDNGEGLDPLPRAMLADAFAAYEQDPPGQREVFMSQRFWTIEYVGAGPFKLVNWEPGSHLEAAAFDGHALGKPKVDRVIMRLMNDENAVTATVLAGQAHVVVRDIIGFENSKILQQEGGFNDKDQKGKLLFNSTATTTAVVQHRPEYQQTAALHDVRVRRAIAHTIDKEAINIGLYDGQAPIAYTFVSPESPYFADIERAVTKYAFDPRRAEELMREAGFAKDNDGFFASPSGERFQPAFWNPSGAQQREQQLLAIMVNTWQRAGIDVQPYVMPNTLARDQQARATFPGILAHGIGLSEATSAMSLVREQIGTPSNRWAGNNRGGWSNPEYEALWERFNSTLDRAEQIQTMVQMMKLHSELAPTYPLYFLISPFAHVAAVKGPQGGVNTTTAHWNIYEWEMTS